MVRDVEHAGLLLGLPPDLHEEIRREEKTSFTTCFGTYCYVRMPEGLRNAGCTFNRTIGAVLGTQLDRSISAYVDDIIVRSK